MKMKKNISIALALAVLITNIMCFAPSAFANVSHNIYCTDCYATKDFNSHITSAEAGEYFYLDIESAPEGKYCTGFNIAVGDDESFTNDIFVVMQDADMYITAVFAEKSNYEFDLTDGSEPIEEALLLTLFDNLSTVDLDPETTGYDGYFMLDDDDVPDVYYSKDARMLYLSGEAAQGNVTSIGITLGDPFLYVGEVKFKFKDSVPPVNTYTVRWVMPDGTVIATAENVEEGTTIAYPGKVSEIPTPLSTTYIYTFTGWSPTPGPITGDTTYVAQYSKKIRTRTVTWKNYDGTVLKVDKNIPVNQPVEYTGTTPKRASDGVYKYIFSGWDSIINNTTGDMVCTAKYKKTKISIKLTAPKKTFKKTAKNKTLTVTLKIDGKPAKSKKITLKVNNKTYTAKTNKKGQAKFKLNLTKKGTYTYTAKYTGKPQNKTAKNKIIIK